MRYEPATITPPIAASPSLTIIKSPQAADAPLTYEQNIAFDKRVTFATTSNFQSGSRMIFTPDGSVTSDGRQLVAGTQNRIVLTCGSLSRSIVLSPVTGRADIQ